MILPADHKELPWTGVFSGMWIVLVYYCGLNQFIVQRNLAAKTLRDGQLGVIFAGALWLLIPFAIVMPGIMSYQLYSGQMKSPDEAFPMLIRNLIPTGLRGFMFAAIAGAVISSLASMLNSASTILTMDIYNRLFDRNASQKRLLLLGRVTTGVFIIAACLLAPRLDDPKFGGVFNYIQQFQGYIWPGVVAAFLFGMLVPQAPGSAGVAALILRPGPLRPLPVLRAGGALPDPGRSDLPVGADGDGTDHLLLAAGATASPARPRRRRREDHRGRQAGRRPRPGGRRRLLRHLLVRSSPRRGQVP